MDRRRALARFDEPLQDLDGLLQQGRKSIPAEWVAALRSLGGAAEPTMTPLDAIEAVWRRAAAVGTGAAS